MSSLVTCLAARKAASVVGLVAEMPFEDGVVRGCLVDLWRALGLRLCGVGDGRQHLVVDDDRLGGVLRLSERFGNDDGNVIADIANLALREGWMGARLHRRAVLRMDHPAADEAADLVFCKILARENVDDTRHLSCLRDVDTLHQRMGMGRADEVGLGLSGPVDVAGIVAPAGNETQVFLPTYRRAHSGRSHGGSSRSC